MTKQVFAGAIGTCCDTSLDCTYKNQGNPDYSSALGKAVFGSSKITPGGVLVFFPSYRLMDAMVQVWTESGLLLALEKAGVSVFSEPREASALDAVMTRYYAAIDARESDASNMSIISNNANSDISIKKSGNSGRAVFFAVCRGKVSEGINFSDNYARTVMLIGVPFPATKDPFVILKREYQDKKHVLDAAIVNGEGWYKLQAYRAINQAIGRCIRHKNDFGAIMLLDPRFQQSSMKSQLSRWLRSSVCDYSRFEDLLLPLQSFFASLTVSFSLGRNMNVVKVETETNETKPLVLDPASSTSSFSLSSSVYSSITSSTSSSSSSTTPLSKISTTPHSSSGSIIHAFQRMSDTITPATSFARDLPVSTCSTSTCLSSLKQSSVLSTPISDHWHSSSPSSSSSFGFNNCISIVDTTAPRHIIDHKTTRQRGVDTSDVGVGVGNSDAGCGVPSLEVDALRCWMMQGWLGEISVGVKSDIGEVVSTFMSTTLPSSLFWLKRTLRSNPSLTSLISSLEDLHFRNNSISVTVTSNNENPSMHLISVSDWTPPLVHTPPLHFSSGHGRVEWKTEEMWVSEDQCVYRLLFLVVWREGIDYESCVRLVAPEEISVLVAVKILAVTSVSLSMSLLGQCWVLEEVWRWRLAGSEDAFDTVGVVVSATYNTSSITVDKLDATGVKKQLKKQRCRTGSSINSDRIFASTTSQLGDTQGDKLQQPKRQQHQQQHRGGAVETPIITIPVQSETEKDHEAQTNIKIENVTPTPKRIKTHKPIPKNMLLLHSSLASSSSPESLPTSVSMAVHSNGIASSSITAKSNQKSLSKKRTVFTDSDDDFEDS